MFDQLSRRLGMLFKKIRGQARLSEANVADAVKEVRTALLEADVHLSVTRAFTEEVRMKALGADVLYSIRPADAFVKIVHDSLVKFLGGAVFPIRLDRRPSVLLLMGLQGSGKTTTAAKLAAFFLAQQKSSLLVTLDRSRPAASEQLEKLAKKAGVRFLKTQADAPSSAKTAVAEAERQNVPVVILDSAGRTEVDPAVFAELRAVRDAVPVEKKILVIDAMTGQVAVNVAKGFADEVGVDGVILTKFDSDTRGGAALSVYHLLRAPILFVGEGEALNRLAPFHPDRMAGRILGMGDVVSLVEKAEQSVKVEDAERAAKRMAKGEMTFEDFLEQIRAVRKMGPLGELLQHLPGGLTGKIKFDTVGEDGEKGLTRVEAMILSMTKAERRRPDLLTPARRTRIARGSGVQIDEVHRLVKRFEDFKKMMKKAVKMGMMGRLG
ncbi:MAG: signal recognition particle protein [Candidatus Lindowbacteria bacterium RIFCSPLOWO2_12_FULL_62_27]|nr:MAG: signal recognition particle protein [Candidatus Lindowbacteria bacterium RIFCSPLOWO2_02_FULL_62_12]OGH62584.1 MAG: signal recognition particle protein [Candidatus Lindowbacteria bacterium RIFCSPLOWO2_12_FULL_62_27]